MGYRWLGEGWPVEVGSRRSSRDFDVRTHPATQGASRIVAGLRMCLVDRPRPVARMGASRARDVNGSTCRPGSAWFRSNGRSCSVPAVFGLPLRSDRGSRRADAVVIPPTLCSRQDLIVIAPLGFKVHRRMRRQGGTGRPDGLAGSRTERGETMRRGLEPHRGGVLPELRRDGRSVRQHVPCRLLEHLIPVGTRATATDPAQLVSHRGAQPTRRPQRPQRSQARSYDGRDAGRRESCGDR